MHNFRYSTQYELRLSISYVATIIRVKTVIQGLMLTLSARNVCLHMLDSTNGVVMLYIYNSSFQSLSKV